MDRATGATCVQLALTALSLIPAALLEDPSDKPLPAR